MGVCVSECMLVCPRVVVWLCPQVRVCFSLSGCVLCLCPRVAVTMCEKADVYCTRLSESVSVRVRLHVYLLDARFRFLRTRV